MSYEGVIQSTNSYWWRYMFCIIYAFICVIFDPEALIIKSPILLSKQNIYGIFLGYHRTKPKHNCSYCKRPKSHSYTKHFRNKYVPRILCVYIYSQMSNFTTILQITTVVNVRKSVAWRKCSPVFLWMYKYLVEKVRMRTTERARQMREAKGLTESKHVFVPLDFDQWQTNFVFFYISVFCVWMCLSKGRKRTIINVKVSRIWFFLLKKSRRTYFEDSNSAKRRYSVIVPNVIYLNRPVTL